MEEPIFILLIFLCDYLVAAGSPVRCLTIVNFLLGDSLARLWSLVKGKNILFTLVSLPYYYPLINSEF